MCMSTALSSLHFVVFRAVPSCARVCCTTTSLVAVFCASLVLDLVSVSGPCRLGASPNTCSVVVCPRFVFPPMFNFDDDTYDMDEAIEQETFAEDMYGFPELVSAGQQAPEDPMQSWIEAFQDDQVFSARGEDDEVASVPSVPLGWSPPTPTSGRSSGSATSTLLPFASRACGPQDSTSPLDNLPRVVNPAFTYAATRRRLRGKRGDAEVARDALAAVALRARPHYQAFRKLSRAAQKTGTKLCASLLESSGWHRERREMFEIENRGELASPECTRFRATSAESPHVFVVGIGHVRRCTP